jgi:hypothetical protein
MPVAGLPVAGLPAGVILPAGGAEAFPFAAGVAGRFGDPLAAGRLLVPFAAGRLLEDGAADGFEVPLAGWR